MGDLSFNFSKRELRCPHCKKCEMDPFFIIKLQQFRDEADAPVVVKSGYRCPEHNKEVGGVPHSEHVEGIAADITIEGWTLQEMYNLAVKVGFTGIGVYDGHFIHVDTRPKRARWSRVNGKYLALTELVKETDA